MFFNNKENAVIDLMKEHLTLVKETLETFKNFIYLYCEGASEEILKEHSFRIHVKEHEADEKEKNIQKEIVGGAFLPFYRENFIVIPEMIDKLAGIAVDVAKEIYLYGIKPDDELTMLFKELVDRVLDTYYEFLNMFEYLPKDYKKIIEISELVSKNEQKSDSVEWKTKVYIMKKSKNYGLIEKQILKNLTTNISDIADRIQNTADYIELTMIKMKV